MPDPVPDPVAAPATQTVTDPPTPATAVPAVSPPEKPTSPASETATPDIDPSMRFEIPKKDGSGVEVATLQDMADAFLAGKDGPSVPDDQAKRFEAFNKAIGSNDRQAMHDLLDLYVSPEDKVDDAPKSPQEQRVAALETELAQVKALVTDQSPIVQQIEDARIQTGVKSLIQQHATNLPYLAHDSSTGARMVTNKLAEYRQAAKDSMGLTDEQFNKHPRKQQILAAAMMDCERQIKADVDRYRGFDPKAAAPSPQPGTPGVTVVDDQANGNPLDRIPARFKVGPDGRLIGGGGQTVGQTAHGTVQTVPGVPLASDPSGTAVGPEAPPPLTGSYTPDALRDRMKVRMQEIATQ